MKLNIFLKQLCFSVEDKEKVLKIMLKNLEILSLEENSLNEITSNLKEILYKSDFEEFLDTEIRKHPYYNSFSFWYEKFLNRDYY